tara:strand:+ start:69 stop:224 length:156 start_codon:yes stop_codon:yes gene_type:complete
MINPITTNSGAKIIRLELNNSSLKTSESPEPPPDIRIKPKIINTKPIPNSI